MKRLHTTLTLLAAGCAGRAGMESPTMLDASVVAPKAEARPHEVTSPHGSRTDNYYWLRDDTRKDPDVLAYLEAENAYRSARMAHLKQIEDTLFEEIVGRIKKDDSSVPYRYRGYYYYRRFESGGEYPIYGRKKGSLESAEEVVLDANALAKGHDFYRLANWEVSPNAQLVAFAEDTVGRRQYDIRFKDLTTGALLPDTLPGNGASLAWANDSKTVFYVEKDPETLLGIRVKKHVLGTAPETDQLVYEEQDRSFYMGVGRTSDDAYVLITLSSTVSNEVRFAPADTPEAFEVLLPRTRDHEYDADHINGRWVLRTNRDATNFRVVSFPDGAAGTPSKWAEEVPHRSDVYVHGFTLFDDYLAVSERANSLRQISVQSWDKKQTFVVASDDAAYVAGLGTNPEQDTHWLRYSYSSLTTPRSVFEINMKTQERRLLKQEEVLGGFDASRYHTDRLWATARDGTKVPITVLTQAGFKPDGTAPLYQYGYGSYGASMDPYFLSHVLSLVDRGVVFAIAHIRGGQEMGRVWYDDGKLLNKKNTFTDFIDVTEHLVKAGYAHPKRVAAAGGSAGGLLVGAVMNMRPDLYKAVLAAVPFVDIVTTMLDESIPLTTNEFDEWGNPKKQPYYDYMLSYSPYDNVAAQDYPAALVTTGLWDSQVQYYEPAKWVAKLRSLKTNDTPLLFHINMEAGHGGKSGRFRRHRERAMEYSFVLEQLGVLK